MANKGSAWPSGEPKSVRDAYDKQQEIKTDDEENGK
jgi:hypothetical protein